MYFQAFTLQLPCLFRCSMLCLRPMSLETSGRAGKNCENRILPSSCLSLSVYPSIRMRQPGSHETDFHEIWYLSISRKSMAKIQSFVKLITGTLHEDQYTFFINSLSHFLEWEIFQTKAVGKIEIHILWSIPFFPGDRGSTVCCTTNRKVAGSIPARFSGFFIDIKSFRTHYDPGVDSASNRNEYQDYFLGVKAAGA